MTTLTTEAKFTTKSSVVDHIKSTHNLQPLDFSDLVAFYNTRPARHTKGSSAYLVVMASTLPFSLEALRSHAIFVPPASTSTDDGWELVDTPDLSAEGLPAPRNARIAVRDKDLIVAFGKEVRMTSLAGEGWEVNSGSVGAYKTLKSPHLTFAIHQVVVNPTGRLLAVVGHHQLVIIVLPRAGFASASGGEVAVRSFHVDEYQHSPSSTAALTKVVWHPWGESGNSLWVLASDGKLFEYDVLRPQDPVQTFNFLPEKATRVKAKFSAIDPLSQYASSFTFSAGDFDFGPLMVYVLMANGDVYTMGPALPLHADVPATYLQSLSAWVTERTKRLEKADAGQVGDEGSAERAAYAGRIALQAQWVDALLRQARDSREDGDVEQNGTPSRRRGFGLRESTVAASPAKADRPGPGPGMVRVHPPHLTESGGPAPGVHRPLVRQGPLLFDPSAQEVGNGDGVDEQSATDLIVLRASGDNEDESGPRLNVMAIAWSAGRVDLGVAIETPEPRWVTSRDPAPADVTLPILESILISYPASAEPEAVEANTPSLVSDPVHPDVVYVQSSFGVDAISVAPWVKKLLDGGEGDLPGSEVAPLIAAAPSRPIVGTVTFCNITLGYGILGLASSGQLATVELDFRVQDRGDGAPPAEVVDEPTPADVPDAQSLLVKPFDTKAIIASVRSPAQPFNPRAAVRKLPDSGKQLATIGPDHLRALADASSQVRAQAEAVRTASAAVERRVDLQVAEFARQLSVLRDAAARAKAARDTATASAERYEQMVVEQVALADRLDAILSAMLAEYRPQIGQVERKWFDELDRLRQRVNGGAAVRRNQTLLHRAQVLKEQLGVVRPLAEAAQKDEGASESHAYGHKQLRPLEQALGSRADELARMMRKLESLNIKVESAAAAQDEEQ
ncbi:hypothetical protein Q8F55_005024 [Vanrija albida]|uniref:Nucleoporin Nup54 alpha-helical domain-containing protein n=1 Tax=Vanrija albida TaxID=181172 RepID=A0ABR3Q0G5_9TREE